MADEDQDVDLARRRLLKAMVYAAPVVTSKVLIKKAHAQATSCGPSGCAPGQGCNPGGCPPIGGPCNPYDCSPRS